MNRVIDVELCRRLDEDWLSGFARAGETHLLFVSGDAEDRLEALLEDLQVDPARVRTFQGRFSILIDASLALGPVCGTGKPNLSPGSEIRPVGGRGGILSCFAHDEKGGKYGLTVEHLFAERAGDVCHKDGKAGTFARDGELDAKGEAPADCAVFSVDPDAVLTSSLAPSVASADLPYAEKLSVHRASKPLQVATVASVTACVKYSIDVVNAQGKVEAIPVKVTEQVLLFDDSGTFASEGESGSLVLMSEAGGAFQRYAPLGLCTAFFTGQRWFVASPLAACLDRLKVSFSP